MRALCLAVLLLLLTSVQGFAATVTNLQGTEVTWITGGATLASNAQAVSGTVALGANAGHLHAYCNFGLSGTSPAPAAGTAIVVWISVSTDGTTFPDGDATVTPPTIPTLTFPLRAVTTAQSVSARLDKMPVGVFRVVVRNDGTGATINTAWTLKCRTYTPQIN